ncbi:diguanylate cyclase [Wukongibacter baidiensis]|uniref:sensor domain-containing diguanylate cyclase n=1 Tax=Wukongibacter baidiensis TaxID=1723361 RepID=UPI003D7F2719
MRKSPLYLKLINRISLRQIIIIPIIIILLFGAIISYTQIYSFVSKYSERVIIKSQSRIKDQIYSHLDNYFKAPEYINSLNASLAKNGQLDIKDEGKLGKILLDEVKSHANVDYAYFANNEGGLVSSGLYKGVNRISYTEEMKQGAFKVYEADDEGNIIAFIKSIDDFDPRTRSWYQEAKIEGEAFWTEVYSGAQEPVLGISASYPLITESGEKIGVFGTDVLLSQMSNFLQNMEISDNGVVCLVDSEGLMIASSTDEEPFKYKDGSQSRLSAEESSNAIIREGYRLLVDHKTEKGPKNLRGNASIIGDNYYFDISTYSYNDKINWYLLIAAPRKDFLGDIEVLFSNFSMTFLVVILFTLILGIYISRWILKPIKSLNDRVNQVKNENWGVQIETDRNDELGQLTRSFNEMSAKIKVYLTMLNKKQEELEFLNTNLEEIVEERTKELEVLSTTDGLTNIYNRRFLIKTLERNIEECKRYGKALSIIIFDIDHFKKVNDTYGHAEGDTTLIEVSRYLDDAIRSVDVLGRYGGEEFMIILPNTGLEDTYSAAERFRREISELTIGDMGIKITISGGVAEYDGGSLIELIKRADKNLYRAKENGRNRIEK